MLPHVPVCAFPRYFSWDTIPLAFHGANRSGLYNATTVQTLAKYQLVTIVRAPPRILPVAANVAGLHIRLVGVCFGTFYQCAGRLQEKWYTACGSEHPFQAGPECDVEKAMYQTFNGMLDLCRICCVAFAHMFMIGVPS